jgi:hypothetical protein
MRQFDLSMGGMRFLLTLQDPDSGGFFNRRDQMDASGMQDVWNSSQAGLTCLVTGHVEEALATAAFLERVYDLQPDVKHRLYNVYSPSRGLVTDPVEGEEKPFVVDASKPAQYYFQPGIAAAFLCRVYMGTGEKKHLNLARKYIGFVEGCKHLYSAPQVCKVGWGAALLYQTTKEARYYHLAQNVAQYLVDHQFPEGYWLNIPSHRALPKVLEVTEEFVVHLDTILNALST